MKKLLILTILFLAGCTTQLGGDTLESSISIVNPQQSFNTTAQKAGSSIPVAYEVNIKENIGDDDAIEFIEGDNYLSFKPTRIGFDGKSITPLVDSVKVKVISDGDEVNIKEARQIDGATFPNVFGEGISIGVLAYKEVFSKITKIDSLSNLGVIPKDAKFLELEFAINTTYNIPVGIIGEGIELRDKIVLKKSIAWDMVSEIDIESEIVDRSGQLYLIKRIPVEWLKTAQFPIHSDADTLVDADCQSAMESSGHQGPYWIDTEKGIILFSDSGYDAKFAYTDDGGATWAATELQTATQVSVSLDTWFDRETPGDTGTLVHVAWIEFNGDNAHYVTIDVSDGSVGTIRTVKSGLTVASSPSTNQVAITKTISGNIIYALSTPTEIECQKSSDGFATAGTVIADFYETPAESDYLLLFPATTDDEDDAFGLFWDRSANEITGKTYDDSGDSIIEGGSITAADYLNIPSNFDGAVRHSDGHVISMAHSSANTNGDDLLTNDWTTSLTPSETDLTTIISDTNNLLSSGVIINQQNDDIYMGYIGGGGTAGANIAVEFVISTDDGSTWGAVQDYGETDDDMRAMHGGRTVSDSGGRIQWSWFNDDLLDIFVNLVNDIEISAAAGASAGYSDAELRVKGGTDVLIKGGSNLIIK